MSGITIINKENATAAPRPGPSNHGAWLAELESAQWQQRMRYQGGAAQGGQGGATPDDAPAARRQAARGPAADQSAQEGGRAARPENAAAAGAHDSQAHPAGAPGARDAAPVRSPYAALPASFQQPQRAAQGGPQGAPRLPAPRVQAQWQAQHAHVLAGAEGVRMWLRDARYGKGDGQRLLQSLRGQFARMGLRLAALTLNGESITAGAQPDGKNNDIFQRGE